MAINGAPKKFLSPAKYRLIIHGVGEVASTRKIGGLGVTADVAEYYEAGNPNPVAQLPTTNKWEDLSVERGRTLDHSIRDWCDRCISGQYRKEDLEKEITVQTLDLNGAVLFADTYHRGFAIGYKESDKESKPGDVVIETLTIKHMGRDLTQR
jgi:phage tail-like protein